MNQCSVVMVSYHTGSVLFAAIRAVLAQHALAELVLVNNGNPPEVESRLQALAVQYPDRFRLMSGHGNVGFARGCNIGAAQASGDYVLLLNPDCLLPPDALVMVMGEIQSRPHVMMAGCLLLNPDGTEQRGGRRQLLTPLTALSEALMLHRFTRMKRLNDHEDDAPAEVVESPAISGAFMCLRRQDYHRLGGMDEGYFLHVEDLDFCMRVQKAGGKIIVVPKVKVIHLCSTSEAKNTAVEWHKAKGFLRYFNQHFVYGKTAAQALLAHLAKAGALLRYALKWCVIKLKKGRLARAVPGEIDARKLLLLLSYLEQSQPHSYFSGKTVLVTGASGQLGLCVCGRLLAAGAAVLMVGRNPHLPNLHERQRWLKGDLTNGPLHTEGLAVDVAMHCAPLWLLPDQLEALAAAGIRRVVAFGSTSLYGKACSRDAYERQVVEKLAKAEQEIARRASVLGIEWTILRPTMIYGVGLDANVSAIAKFCRRLRFFPLYPPAEGLRQPVHVDDLAQAALSAACTPTTFAQAYNLSGGERLTYRAMVERIFETLGQKPRLLFLPVFPCLLNLLQRVRRGRGPNGEMALRMNEDLVFFHDEAQRDFGYAPRKFLSGGKKDLQL